MGSGTPQQPNAAGRAGRRESGAAGGNDEDRSADLAIKAGGIYSMSETREADARRSMATATLRRCWLCKGWSASPSFRGHARSSQPRVISHQLASVRTPIAARRARPPAAAQSARPVPRRR